VPKLQGIEQVQRRNIALRIAKKVVLNLISILGRSLTGRNPWITRLNSIGNSSTRVRYVEKVCQVQSGHIKDFGEFLNTASVASHKWLGDGPDKNFVAMCLARLPIEHIGESSIRRAERLDIPLRASFRVSLTLRSKKKELFRLNEWRLDDKRVGSRYAGRLGVRFPALLQDCVPFREIDLKACTVIKPVFGAASTGVYTIDGAGEVICVKEARKIPGTEELKNHADGLMKEGLVRIDQWLVEELIPGPDGQGAAADIKCYTFYGQTELVRYIRRYPRFQSSWFDRDGCLIDSPDDKPNPQIAKAVVLADRIGGTIPAPFIRIDLLEGKDEMVFGEFTPRPGSYCEHDAETDFRLGVAFLAAEERLLDHLLKGAKFPEYSAEFGIDGTGRKVDEGKAPVGNFPASCRELKKLGKEPADETGTWYSRRNGAISLSRISKNHL